MKEALPKLDQKTLTDSPSVIFSLVSAAGLSRSDLREFRKIRLSGREARLANRLARQENNSDSSTRDTSRQSSSTSSASATLQSSLGSRLRQQLQNRGCAIYKLTWKEKTTPSGLPYSQLVASAHRTKEKDSSLGQPWATATTRSHRDSGDLSRSFMRNDGRMRNDTLYRQMWLHTFGPNGKPTKEQMVKLESFHPIMARQIMGYPPEWDDCAVTAMPSSRK